MNENETFSEQQHQSTLFERKATLLEQQATVREQEAQLLRQLVKRQRDLAKLYQQQEQAEEEVNQLKKQHETTFDELHEQLVQDEATLVEQHERHERQIKEQQAKLLQGAELFQEKLLERERELSAERERKRAKAVSLWHITERVRKALRPIIGSDPVQLLPEDDPCNELDVLDVLDVEAHALSHKKSNLQVLRQGLVHDVDKQRVDEVHRELDHDSLSHKHPRL
jgi:DNA repair exonuclease SbcCD ATPase subunit